MKKYIAIFLIFSVVILLTYKKNNFVCTRTCENRVVFKILNIKIIDIIKTNETSQWVKSILGGDIKNDWFPTESETFLSQQDGTISEKIYFINALCRKKTQSGTKISRTIKGIKQL